MKDSAKNKGEQNQRLLGIVRFFDPIKCFGFIDTNGYGIDSPSSEIELNSTELFFSQNDMEGRLFTEPGDWVSFVYERVEGKKRDRARFVKYVTFSEEDFKLALNYHNGYSTILYRGDTIELKQVNVIAEITHNLHINNQNKQLLFDSIISAFTQKDLDAQCVIESFLRDNLNFWSLFLRLASDESVVVKDTEFLDSILTAFAITLFQREIDANLLVDCLNHLNPKGLDEAWSSISSCALIQKDKGRSFFSRFISYAQYLPKNLTIRIIARVKIWDEDRISETREGRLFTWGEGWQETYTTHEYLIKYGKVDYFVEQGQYVFINELIIDLKDRLYNSALNFLKMKKGYNEAFGQFAYGRLYIFQLSLLDTVNDNYIFLCSFDDLKAKIQVN